MKIIDFDGNVTDVPKDAPFAVFPDGRVVKFLSDKALRARTQREIDARLRKDPSRAVIERKELEYLGWIAAGNPER